jgi:hypothetical protein
MEMTQRKLKLSVLEVPLSISQLDASAEIPECARSGPFCSVTRTSEELSIICLTSVAPSGVRRSDGWRAFRVDGQFDFSECGVLASIVGPFAMAGISVLTICTYNTDYVLVRESDVGRAIEALERVGHEARRERSPA